MFPPSLKLEKKKNPLLDPWDSGLDITLVFKHSFLHSPVLTSGTLFPSRFGSGAAMIEVVAELSRGPVFLAGEALECVVTVTNPLPPTATSASRWGCWY